MKKNTYSPLGSSETTREAPLLESPQTSFIFHRYLAPQHKKTLDFEFLTWFIGFTEGDGCFYVQKDQGKLRVCFSLVQKDSKLINKIRTCLGFGTVSSTQQKGQVYWKYAVYDKQGIQRLITLFHGNLLLPKRVLQFHRWVTVASSLGLCSTDFQKIPTRQLCVSLDTAWLSGFIEAEGCLCAAFRAPFPGSRLSAKFSQKCHITQQDLAGELTVLEQIGHLCESKAAVRLVKKETHVYRLEMCCLRSNQILINYLNRFPMRGKKQVTFVRWRGVFFQRQKKEHLTEKGIQRMKRLCDSIRRDEKQEDGIR